MVETVGNLDLMLGGVADEFVEGATLVEVHRRAVAVAQFPCGGECRIDGNEFVGIDAQNHIRASLCRVARQREIAVGGESEEFLIFWRGLESAVKRVIVGELIGGGHGSLFRRVEREFQRLFVDLLSVENLIFPVFSSRQRTEFAGRSH